MTRVAIAIAVSVAAAAGLSAHRPAAPALATAQQTTATLTGRLESPSQTPLGQVRIALMAAGVATVYETTTDDAGGFVFKDIRPGAYRAVIQRASYTIALGQVRLLAGESLSRVFRKGVVVVGRVVDETGVPRAGVPVCLFRITRQSGLERFERVTAELTNLVGEFVLGRDPIVERSDYVVAAVPTGCDQSTLPAPGSAIASRYGPTYHPGTSSPVDAARMSFTVEQDTEITLALRPLAVTRLQGRVTNYVNTSVVRDLVRLEPLTGEPLAIARTADVQRDGSFVFPGVVPGQYRVMLAPRKGPDPTVWVNEVVTVRGESVASVTFAAQPTRTIGGTLSFAGRPTPLYETEVFLVVNAEPIGDSPSVLWALGGNFGRVSVNGHFGITGLMPGKYRLSVSGADAFGWRPKFATVPGSERRLAELDGLDAAFTVGPNQDVLGVRIDMTMATTTVTGRIDDEEGRPASGADLVVFAPDSRYWIPGSRRLARTRAGVRGEFQITTLPEGDYLAAATNDAGTEPLPEWLESLRPRAVPFRLDDGEVQELALRLPGGLSALLRVDCRSRRPVARPHLCHQTCLSYS